ncbi:MAG TPA: sigma-70 family RNA polymerase sigma factor [Stellaceae bacterium]|jgi:RNA polymerase sigma-70 factor (ECF subfamily)|nr:sigma-70 family RNA polymerase sigma factor [Stellaceae bacterium]
MRGDGGDGGIPWRKAAVIWRRTGSAVAPPAAGLAPDGLASDRLATGVPFETAVLPHLDAAYNLARWLVRDACLAEDVAQDALLRALGYFASFRGEDAKAWLMRIVRNTAYDALGRRGHEISLDAGAEGEDGAAPALQVADTAPDPEAVLARRRDLAQLDEAIAALPVELRECLVLRELEELSYKEISEVTGVPIGTVMSRLWRARRALVDGRGIGGQEGGIGG